MDKLNDLGEVRILPIAAKNATYFRGLIPSEVLASVDGVDHFMLGAVDADKRPVSALCFTTSRLHQGSDKFEIEIDWIGTLTECRGEGYGGALVDELCRRADECDCREIYAKIDDSHLYDGLYDLLTSHGFDETRRLLFRKKGE